MGSRVYLACSASGQGFLAGRRGSGAPPPTGARRRRWPTRPRAPGPRPRTTSGGRLLVDAPVDLELGRRARAGRALARVRAILGRTSAMNACPPKPGCTVMHRIRSASARKGSMASYGVSGLMARPARSPSALASPAARRCRPPRRGPCSRRPRPGGTTRGKSPGLVIIRWQSKNSPECRRSDSHHGRADGQVGHEVAVHDVDVQPVGLGSHLAHRLGQAAEVGRQHRRGDPQHPPRAYRCSPPRPRVSRPAPPAHHATSPRPASDASRPAAPRRARARPAPVPTTVVAQRPPGAPARRRRRRSAPGGPRRRARGGARPETSSTPGRGAPRARAPWRDGPSRAGARPGRASRRRSVAVLGRAGGPRASTPWARTSTSSRRPDHRQPVGERADVLVGRRWSHAPRPGPARCRGPPPGRIRHTPVSSSPARTARSTGAAPRHRGRSEKCTFTMGSASRTRAGTRRP